MRQLLFFLLWVTLTPLWAQQLELPNSQGGLRFAVIGDSGSGGKAQYEVADQIVTYRRVFPFGFVLMLGDNIYGRDKPRDYEAKFEQPYRALLAAGVKFYAALGNHDNPNQRFYKLFNMNGERYYTFRPQGGIRFFALDSSYMDQEQLGWLEKQLSSSGSEWKICFFHHPIYSSGKRHGSNVELRKVLEPLFVKYGVNVVLAGHEHFYERLKPQAGIYYFTSGGAARLRQGNIGSSALTAKGFDQDNHFMLMEIEGDKLFFQTISRTGTTVDSGVLTRSQGKALSAAAK